MTPLLVKVNLLLIFKISLKQNFVVFGINIGNYNTAFIIKTIANLNFCRS